MALNRVTGHDLTLTINSINYDNVASSATLSMEINQAVLETLSGRSYKTIDQSATLDVELYQDWGSTSPASVCEALWAAANSAPDTAIAFTLDASGVTLSGNIFPVFPALGGAATDALTVSLSFVVEDGAVTSA